jgi:hypothetical protein
MSEVVLVYNNGLTEGEIRDLNRRYGRATEECGESVDLMYNSGFAAPGGYFMKIKGERYS